MVGEEEEEASSNMHQVHDHLVWVLCSFFGHFYLAHHLTLELPMFFWFLFYYLLWASQLLLSELFIKFLASHITKMHKYDPKKHTIILY